MHVILMMTFIYLFLHLMTFFWTYSAYRKSSYPFISFTFLLCCIIILNCIKLLFFLHINRHPFTIMTKKKLDLSQLANLKHWKEWHCTSLLLLWHLKCRSGAFQFNCFYTLTGVNLWQIQLNQSDMFGETYKWLSTDGPQTTWKNLRWSKEKN